MTLHNPVYESLGFALANSMKVTIVEAVQSAFWNSRALAMMR